MEMSLWAIFTLMVTHWFADFVFQTNKQAQNKSTSIWALLSHTTTYAITFLIPVYLLLWAFTPDMTFEWYASKSILYVLVTFVAHTVTDFFTSKLNKKLMDKKKIREFFISMDFDQTLHYTQLYLTFYYILP